MNREETYGYRAGKRGKAEGGDREFGMDMYTRLY